MSTFALEKQTRLQRKQTRFILTLPVAGAVAVCIGGFVVLVLYYVYACQSKLLSFCNVFRHGLFLTSLYHMYKTRILGECPSLFI